MVHPQIFGDFFKLICIVLNRNFDVIYTLRFELIFQVLKSVIQYVFFRKRGHFVCLHLLFDLLFGILLYGLSVFEAQTLRVVILAEFFICNIVLIIVYIENILLDADFPFKQTLVCVSTFDSGFSRFCLGMRRERLKGSLFLLGELLGIVYGAVSYFFDTR